MEDKVYNIQCNRIRKNNAVFLELFEKDMIAEDCQREPAADTCLMWIPISMAS